MQEIAVWERSPRRLSAETVRLSVVIPTLQEERALARLLPRFDDATIERYGIELIISDGGSRDRTIEVAQQYADVVVMHRAARRQTIAEGRNLGATVARADVLVFLNADCVPANWQQFWETLAKWAAPGGPYCRFAALAAPVKVAPEERRLSDAIVHAAFNAYLQCATRIGLGVGRGECQVVRRWVFEKAGGYNPSLVAGEDFEFLHRVRRWTPVAIPRALCVYESPRRYRRWGYRRILWQWFLNWFSAIVMHRSAAKEWTPVRD